MKIPGGFNAIKRTFASRNYRLYVIGNLSSTTGLWVQRVAIGWLTWELTHSAAWLGGIVIAESIPTLILGLFGGAMVDRMDYLRLLRFAQLASLSYSVIMAIASFGGVMTIWLLLGMTIFRGCVMAFSRPSRMTLVFSLVPRDLLSSALAMNSMIFNVSRFIGPATGGAIIAAGGAYGVAFAFVTAASLLLVMTTVLGMMKLPPFPRRERAQGASVLSETIEGIRYVFLQPTIRIQLILLIGTSLFAKPVIDLFPGFAASVFHQGAHGLGLLLSLHGLGAALGAAWLASRSGMKGLTVITITNILFMGVALLLFTATDMFWLGCIMSCVMGVVFIIMSIGNQTLIQASVDPDLRGRVIAVYGMIAQDLPAVGTMIMGGLAEHFGLRWPVAVGAALCLILWYWGRRHQGWMAAVVEADASKEKVKA